MAKTNWPMTATTNQNPAAALKDASAKLRRERCRCEAATAGSVIWSWALISVLLKRVIESSVQTRSDRSLTAAQAHGGGEKCRGDGQADPQTRTDQEFFDGEWCQITHRHASGRWGGSRVRAAEAVSKQGGEMRSVEGNLLHDADCE